MTSKISRHTDSYIPYRTVLPEGYLCPDPEPILDGMQQSPIVTECDHLLRHYFETGDRADVLVASDGFIFYDESSLNIRVNPDLYITFGVDAGSVFSRNGYVIWEAGKPPDFALEVASESTHRQDTERKPGLYARIGIGEYWRFDGNGGEFYGYVLAGDRLVDGAYQPIPITSGLDGMGWSGVTVRHWACTSAENTAVSGSSTQKRIAICTASEKSRPPTGRLKTLYYRSRPPAAKPKTLYYRNRPPAAKPRPKSSG